MASSEKSRSETFRAMVCSSAGSSRSLNLIFDGRDRLGRLDRSGARGGKSTQPIGPRGGRALNLLRRLELGGHRSRLGAPVGCHRGRLGSGVDGNERRPGCRFGRGDGRFGSRVDGGHGRPGAHVVHDQRRLGAGVEAPRRGSQRRRLEVEVDLAVPHFARGVARRRSWNEGPGRRGDRGGCGGARFRDHLREDGSGPGGLRVPLNLGEKGLECRYFFCGVHVRRA